MAQQATYKSLGTYGNKVTIAQIKEGAEAATQVFAGRSESLIVVVVGVVLVGFVLWRDTKKQEKDEVRMDRREEQERVKDQHDSDSLRLISESTRRTADATSLMAVTVEKMEHRQERDRRAILSVIESVDARATGDETKAKDALRDARTILITDG
jgi:hypothetical protein